MVDIGLCKYDLCQKKDSCYRYTKKDNINVVHFRFENKCHQDNEFQWYWDVKQELSEVLKGGENPNG